MMRGSPYSVLQRARDTSFQIEPTPCPARYGPMRRVVLVLLILAVSATAADARRRHHRHHHGYESGPTVGVAPDGARASGVPRPGDLPDRFDRRARARDAGDARVPAGWELQPPDPAWQGKRYLSPDGSAWFATYASPAEGSVADHMKTVAFGESEDITYLRGERDWIAVSGFKAERIFYRKAVLACGGRLWRHVAFEYPSAARRAMDGFVRRAAEGLERMPPDGCDQPVSSAR